MIETSLWHGDNWFAIAERKLQNSSFGRKCIASAGPFLVLADLCYTLCASTLLALALICKYLSVKYFKLHENYYAVLTSIEVPNLVFYFCTANFRCMNTKLTSLLCLVALLSSSFAHATVPYKNPKLSPKERTADLLSRMSLEEKVAQLQCRWTDKADFLTDGKFDLEKARRVLPYGMGSLARMNEDLGPGHIPYVSTLHPFQASELYNDIQRYFVEETRLGIPVLGHEEGLHGHQSMDATNFPMPIALACSWDLGLFADIYSVVAKEIRAQGGSQVLAPVVDIVQDPRWGRTEETLGEDPYLASRIGVVEVKAYQGEGDVIDNEHVGATLKHLGIHGRPEGGENTAPSFVDEYTAREFFLKPFYNCVKEAQPLNVMVSYNETWGQPSHASRKLVTDILRGEWGFGGLVVSDYGGVSNLVEIDHLTPDYDEAGVIGLMAGVDIELPSINSYAHLAEFVRSGRIPEARLDEAVSRILEEKFRLGLFEHPYVDPQWAEELVGCKEHRDLAYKAATESMVLLQNKDKVLPLDASKIRTLALIGPNADQCVLGGYSSEPRQRISPLVALREKYGSEIDILHAPGVQILNENSQIPFLNRERSAGENAELIAEAVEVAKKADVVVLCLGENEKIHCEATGQYALGDLPTLELLGGQLELLDAIAPLGKPMVALVSSGTTLNLSPVAQKVQGLVQCWYLGQETGYAMADLLFGKVNPSGKLTISFPRSAGHIPAYYNYKPSSRRGYNLGWDVSALYPFGYGLSYTSFSYANLRIDRSEMGLGDTATVSVEVTNTGEREGAEIVQLYVTDDYALMPRPVKELRGFERINLKPRETKTVSFKLGPEELSYLDETFKSVVEPGSFTIQVGPSSAEGDRLKLNIK